MLPIRLGLATATPALAALRLAHDHTRAEHARHARAMRAPHHACAPRQPCTCSHVTTRAHVKKLGCRARVTGHWLTVGRLAAGTSSANALCNALATSAAREAHASSTRYACHPPPTLHRTQRHDDNERDKDERHDEEDREHDGRCERVRFRSRLRLSRAMAHAHARCQAPLSKTRTLPTPRWPWNDLPFDARHVATVGGPNRAIGRPSTTRITTCSCS